MPTIAAISSRWQSRSPVARGHQHLQRLGGVAVEWRVRDRHTQLTSKVVPMPMPVIHSGTAS
jgi:hypothetical protein